MSEEDSNKNEEPAGDGGNGKRLPSIPVVDATRLDNLSSVVRGKALAEGFKPKSEVTHEEELLSKLRSELSELHFDFKQAQEGQLTLQKQLKKVEASLSKATSSFVKDVDEHRQKILSEFETGLSAAQSAFSEQQAIRAPVELWQEKQSEHAIARDSNYRLFVRGLLASAVFVGFLVLILVSQSNYIVVALAPIGCDPTVGGENCAGLSLKGMLLAAGMLTIFTLLLWFVRLQMKLYLAERHLALDARERLAFAQSYIGLVREGDISEEAKDQRALVYAALFRPASDGTVKEEGGLDPSVAAALSKFLMK